MNDEQKQKLVTEIRELLQKRIKLKSEFEFYEVCEEVLSESLEYATSRMGELREDYEEQEGD